jgi:hypothetical protein
MWGETALQRAAHYGHEVVVQVVVEEVGVLQIVVQQVVAERLFLGP